MYEDRAMQTFCKYYQIVLSFKNPANYFKTYLPTKIGFDTAGNEPSEVLTSDEKNMVTLHHITIIIPYLQPT